MKNIEINRPKQVFFHNVQGENDVPVEQNLAMTPAQMYSLVQQGRPVSLQQLPLDNFDDGTSDPSFYVTMDKRRGVDIVDVWNKSQDLKKKYYQMSKNQVSLQKSNE